MNATSPPRIALLYDDSAYMETLGRTTAAPAGGPAGLMGRQVAGKEFLDAYFSHGTWEELAALVYNQPSARSLANLAQGHPALQSRPRRIQLVDGHHFHSAFFPSPPAPLLYTPCPPDPSFAWARQHRGPDAFALCGVTHTLCTQAAIAVLGELVTAPYEPYDALICTSQAVTQMVRTVTTSYADYLRDRHGGSPGVRLRLETVPLGVNPERFRPPTPQERAAQRRALNVADDEVVVLFVGRLAFHAKAHPVPMFLAVSQAARLTGQKVHLILAGWSSPEVLRMYADAARTFAPEVRVSIVDGTRPDVRFSVWHAADIFTSLSDNIQETFGLVVIEAMACGLPVVASDWDGYRDLVADGQTGFLIPTALVRDATADVTSRFLTMGELDYDSFLGECSQAVSVDVRCAAAGYTHLIRDAALRRRMGEAGRQRVLKHFTWERVIRAYEELWRSQEAQRQERLTRSTSSLPEGRPLRGPARYPVPEVTFESYPTEVVESADVVRALPGADSLLEVLLATPMTSYADHVRVRSGAALHEVLARAAQPCTVADVDAILVRAGASRPAARATLAWMLKYALLELVHPQEEQAPAGAAEEGARAGDVHAQTLEAVAALVEQGRSQPAQALERLLIALARYRSLLLTGDQMSRGGLVVQSGPFAGMRYVPTSAAGPLLPKLLGSYEAELHPILEEIARKGYRRVVNVGCGEGYYAVGLARLLPGADVYAFDATPLARELCGQLAALNGVADRVKVGGTCEAGHLRELAGPGVLVVCDCEGAELEVLRPDQAPGLRQCDLLVEMHDGVDPRISRALRQRFEPTHEVTLIPHGRPPSMQGGAFPGLSERGQLDQLLAVWEGRTEPTPWAWLKARAN